jgi:hypothetical protein
MFRFKAAGTHLLICCAIALMVFLAIATAWYPGALLDTAGGLELFLVVVGVDVTLGPLLTLVVYKPGKKGLAFDLVVIAVLQVSALVYGVHVLFEARPVYVVYVKDRFELVRANDLADEDLAKASGYASLPWNGPRIAAARLPTDPEERFRMMISGMAGKDVQMYPQYYVRYEDAAGEAIAAAKPISRLRELNPGRGEVIDATGLRDEAMRYLPVRAGKRDLTALIDASTGNVVKFVALKPWEYN